MDGILFARDIKSTLGEIDPRAISIPSYKIEISIFKYKKIAVNTWTIQKQDPLITSIKISFAV